MPGSASADRPYVEDMSRISSSQAQRWRVTPALRVVSMLVLLGWVALTLAITVGGNTTPGAGNAPTVMVWLATVVIAVGVWRYAFVPYVEATDAELVVRNAFTERHLPWDQITTIKPGSLGLIVETNEDRLFPRIAWAVQKGRGARWINSSNRADSVTEALMMHVRGITS